MRDFALWVQASQKEITAEERNSFAVSFKNAVGALYVHAFLLCFKCVSQACSMAGCECRTQRRSAWPRVPQHGAPLARGTPSTRCSVQITARILNICKDVLGLVIGCGLVNTANMEHRVFFLKMYILFVLCMRVSLNCVQDRRLQSVASRGRQKRCCCSQIWRELPTSDGSG